MPCTILSCDTCDYQLHNTVLWGNYAYHIEGSEVPLERRLAWCLKCKGFSAVEDSSDLDDCVSHLTQAVRSLAASNRTVVALVGSALIPARRKANAEAVKKAEAYALRIDLIRTRKGSERCLDCGATDWARFGDDAIDTVRSAGSASDIQKTGFMHPECGGEIMAKPIPWRLNCAFKPRRYGFDGKWIEPDV